MRFRRLLFLIVSISLPLFSTLPVNAITDVTPPVLKSLTVTPSSVDTTTVPATVILHAVFRDDLSGVSYANTNLRQPSGAQMSSLVDCTLQQTGALSPTTTVCTALYTFPAHTTPGDYGIIIYAQDVAGNSLLMSPTDLAAAGFTSTIHVTNTN